MSFNGAGLYSPPATDFPAVAGTLIQATKFNNVINDIATGLSTCITKDGQQTLTANIPFNGFYATNAGLRAIAGTVGAPGIAWNDEPSSGWYRVAANDYAFAVAGVKVQEITATLFTLSQKLITASQILLGGATTALSVNSSTTMGLQLATATNAYKNPSFLYFGNDNSGVQVFVGKSRGTTIGATGAGTYPQASDNLGAYQTGGWDDSTAAFASGGQMRGTAGSLWSATNHETYISFYATASASITQAEQVRILGVAGSTNFLTLAGSNGGNPVISTTGGGVTITPALTLSAALTYGGVTLTNAVTGTGNMVLSANPTFSGQVAFAAGNAGTPGFQFGDSNAGFFRPGAGIIAISTAATERWRVTATGYFLASNSGTYNAAAGSYHQFYNDANSAAFLVAEFRNAAATTTNQYGVDIILAGDPNDATRYHLRCGGGATERATLRSNGGLANFSVNNVNLSDVRVKPAFERYSAEMLEGFGSALEQVDWGRFKYDDQTHGDWNHGYTAQGVRDVFQAAAPELVGLWDEEKPDGLLGVYHHDLTNIGLASAVYQIKKLKQQVAELQSKLN